MKRQLRGGNKFLKNWKCNLINGFLDWYRLSKIILILGFGFVIGSLIIILFTPPASGYEFSLYDVYPWFFWGFIIIAIFCGQVIFLLSALNQEKMDNLWKFGFLLIFIVNSILLSLPSIRGYYINGSGDVLTHIGYMRDILADSNFGLNHYPLDHIIGVFVYLFSNITIEQVAIIMPLFFSCFFLFSWIPLAKVTTHDDQSFFFILIFGSLLIFANNHMAFAPNCQVLLFFPFFLYILFMVRIPVKNVAFSVIVYILIFFLGIFHPLISVITIAFLGIIIMINIFNKEGSISKTPIVFLFFLLITIFFTWSSYLYMMVKAVNPIIQSILGLHEINSEFTQKIIFLEFDISPLILLKHVIFSFGPHLIIGFFSIIALFWYFYYSKFNKNLNKEKSVMMIIVFSYIFFFIFSITMFFINGSFGFLRIYNIAVLFAIIILSIWFVKIFFKEVNIQFSRIFFVMGIILIITSLSVFTLYLSPLSRSSNQQVPYSNYLGMTTFFQIRDESVVILEMGLSQDRYYDAIFGRSYPRKNIQYDASNKLFPPDHFGYQSNEYFSKTVTNKQYLLLNDLGKYFYPKIFPEFIKKWRFTHSDFSRLKHDKTVEKIYTNEDLEIFFIY